MLFRVCVYETPLQKALIHIGQFCLFSWADVCLGWNDGKCYRIGKIETLRFNEIIGAAHQRYGFEFWMNALALIFSPVCVAKAMDFILLLVGKYRDVAKGISNYMMSFSHWTWNGSRRRNVRILHFKYSEWEPIGLRRFLWCHVKGTMMW